MLTLHEDAVNNLLIYMFAIQVYKHTYSCTESTLPKLPSPKPSENKPTDWRKATLGNRPKPLDCCLGVIFESALDCLVCFSATTTALQLQTASLLKWFGAAGNGSGGRAGRLLNRRFVV